MRFWANRSLTAMGKAPRRKPNRFSGGVLGTFAQDTAAALQLRHAQPVVSGASQSQIMSRKRIAFLVAYGPEVRAFIHSGFVKAVAENHDVSIIARVRKPSAFDGLNGIPVVEMPVPRETR